MSEYILKPCPFCGCDLTKEYSAILVIEKRCDDEYIQWRRDNKLLIGSDNGYNVYCMRCGATGAVGMTKEEAVQKWNRRNQNQDCRKEINKNLFASDSE